MWIRMREFTGSKASATCAMLSGAAIFLLTFAPWYRWWNGDIVSGFDLMILNSRNNPWNIFTYLFHRSGNTVFFSGFWTIAIGLTLVFCVIELLYKPQSKALGYSIFGLAITSFLISAYSVFSSAWLGSDLFLPGFEVFPFVFILFVVSILAMGATFNLLADVEPSLGRWKESLAGSTKAASQARKAGVPRERQKRNGGSRMVRAAGSAGMLSALPGVFPAMKAHRLRRSRRKMATALPVIALILINIILLMIWAGAGLHDLSKRPKEPKGALSEVSELLVKSWMKEEGFPEPMSNTRMFLVFLGMFAGFLVLLPLSYYKLLNPLFIEFRSLTDEADGYNERRFQTFSDSLYAASIRAGVDAPELVVLGMPTVNTISFRKNKKDFIGVTGEALETGLAPGEIDSLMAHELSHVISGDVLTKLSVPVVVLLPLLALVTLILPIFLLAFNIGPTELSPSLFILRHYVLFFLPFVWILLSLYLIRRYYYESKLHPADFASDILADSIASRITARPQALIDVIKRLVGFMKDTEEVPWEGISLPHLFVGPVKPFKVDVDGHVPFMTELLAPMSDKPVVFDTDRHMRKELKQFLAWNTKLLRKRIDNLEKIKKGNWASF